MNNFNHGNGSGPPPGQNNTHSTDQAELQRLLIELINSQKPKISPNAQTRLLNTRITPEDVQFFRAANAVVKIHQYRIDPTIRDILSRLQYAQSPHGGVPLSREYLEALGMNYPSRLENTQNTGGGAARRNSMDSLPDFSNKIFKPESVDTPLPGFAEALGGSASVLGSSSSNSNNGANPQENQLVLQLVDRIKNMDASQQQNLISGIAQMLVGSLSAEQQQQQQRQQQQSSSAIQLSALLAAQNLNSQTLNPPQLNPQSLNLQPQPIQSQPLSGAVNSYSPFSTDSMKDSSPAQAPPAPTQFIMESPASGSSTKPFGTSSAKSDSGRDKDRRHSGSGPRSRGRPEGKSERRQFSCTECGMAFKRSSDLKRHEKIHLKVPPNICPLCKKGFARKDALKRHIDTLTCRRNREKLLENMKKE